MAKRTIETPGETELPYVSIVDGNNIVGVVAFDPFIGCVIVSSGREIYDPYEPSPRANLDHRSRLILQIDKGGINVRFKLQSETDINLAESTIRSSNVRAQHCRVIKDIFYLFDGLPLGILTLFDLQGIARETIGDNERTLNSTSRDNQDDDNVRLKREYARRYSQEYRKLLATYEDQVDYGSDKLRFVKDFYLKLIAYKLASGNIHLPTNENVDHDDLELFKLCFTSMTYFVLAEVNKLSSSFTRVPISTARLEGIRNGNPCFLGTDVEGNGLQITYLDGNFIFRYILEQNAVWEFHVPDRLINEASILASPQTDALADWADIIMDAN